LVSSSTTLTELLQEKGSKISDRDKEKINERISELQRSEAERFNQVRSQVLMTQIASVNNPAILREYVNNYGGTLSGSDLTKINNRINDLTAIGGGVSSNSNVVGGSLSTSQVNMTPNYSRVDQMSQIRTMGAVLNDNRSNEGTQQTLVSADQNTTVNHTSQNHNYAGALPVADVSDKSYQGR
jgi:hypothetical protein